MMCSSILHEVLVRDMGLKLATLFLSPFLWIGIILAFFQSCGRLEVASDLRKMCPRYLLHHSAYFLGIRLEFRQARLIS